ncbi:hypothetical protein NPS53_08985 [Pseudomonas putida]|uniref:hypothetical protein n=1 Tax=Pseudomonas putida TaxID=303 RepID=UPI002364A6DF|nr:hypothetical protein [Pseudomonas putida]MDD2139709.1 hypothetical protein [Pseudomonas putida]HDS1721633.1 hypothetical protein [Pseudomonas putida]
MAMQLNNPHEVMNHLITLLAAEGVEAFIGKVKPDYEDDELEDGLRIPAWEDNQQQLSRKAVYQWIFSKLAANPRKGLAVEMPGIANSLNVYTIDRVALAEKPALDCWDVVVWNAANSLDHFNWEECVHGDDCAWYEGWDAPDGFGLLSNRVANLLILLHNRLVDLPEVQPFTEAELIEKLKAPGAGGGLYCSSEAPLDIWSLRLSPAGTLEMHKQNDGSVTPITSEHINATGGVVLDGRTIMHRSWGY